MNGGFFSRIKDKDLTLLLLAMLLLLGDAAQDACCKRCKK